ncbi:hypothetical protein JW613_10120 [Streptomyces smyrnaeus]|uniref:Uncharacterized protein n=2 Tax=Streptomyces smyrnaeus TaxID=1387713 RepID=A0ABS3XTD3_9ACTN|nr:hypothetical protein [Streptomyces smyrnaeus]
MPGRAGPTAREAGNLLVDDMEDNLVALEAVLGVLQVLRTKVAVFLDLFRKNRQSRRLLEEEQRRLDDARDVAALADALAELRGS